MKLGAFGLIEDYSAMHKAGYDYAELDIPQIEALTEGEFEDLCALKASEGLPILSGARILPITEPTFFKPDFDPLSLKPYLQRALKRCAVLGMQKVILGNGKARLVPDPQDESYDEVFIRLLTMMASVAEENGLQLILEPLGPRYSNYLNTLGEADRVIKKAGCPNLLAMGDLRHMIASGESLDDFALYLKILGHVHVDFPLSYPERGYPKPGDGYDYGDFVRKLKQSGYDGTLTIEADRPQDWQQARDQAMLVLKDLF